MLRVSILMAIAVVPFVVSYHLNQNAEHGKENVSFRLYNGQKEFAVSLLKTMKRISPESNHIFSPHSTYRALLLAYFGAEGDTKVSLERALHLNWAADKSDVNNAYKAELKARAERAFGPNMKFNSADKIFVTYQAELKPQITGSLVKSIEKMDFSDVGSRREEINSFVKKVTENQIVEILSPGSLTLSTNLVLVNAAFFHGLWATEFHHEHTRMKTFYSTKPAEVEMMHVTSNFSYGVLHNVNAAYLEMPYDGEDSAISMFIYLPLENTPNAVDDLVNKFTVETMYEALSRKQVESVEVEFPKISLDSTYPLGGILQEMGINELFGVASNLTGFADNIRLHFDDAVHKAKIEINEHGTSAAAATATTNRHGYILFYCNHPFMFMINDRISNEVLFTGIYRGPNHN
ncbi:serine protease inhibitor 88Ea-like [Sitodiplosis mosellana]|uniref:serine protease inhibitor 88Ea-like n=1 Tax=Sitodiplosis mosellana TaxID=263140 RepID=UPI00244467D0|nr:serine protease inhibitor 88Ea-like [Sitodiplosis mosellana]